MSEHRGQLSREDEAADDAVAAVYVAYMRHRARQIGIARFIAAFRYAAERLSNDVFDGTGRFDEALHGLIETAPPDGQYGVKEAQRAGPPRHLDADNGR